MPVDSIVDLRHLFGNARNQGKRPTCLAFAVSDAHAAIRGAWAALSCEFIFCKAQERGKKPPTQGATLTHILEALRHDGQPEEVGWPYLALPPDHATWAPPAEVGTLYRRDGGKIPLGALVNPLDQGRAVILLSYLSDSFYAPSAEAVISPAAKENADPLRRHAVIAVGHGTWNGERVVLVRNSWGAGWGDQGYGWLTETFLAPRLFAAAVLTENSNVPGNTLAA